MRLGSGVAKTIVVTKNRDSKPSNLMWNRVDLTEAIALFREDFSRKAQSAAAILRAFLARLCVRNIFSTNRSADTFEAFSAKPTITRNYTFLFSPFVSAKQEMKLALNNLS